MRNIQVLKSYFTTQVEELIMKKPSIKDVAKQADVSPTTVSRYLNNRGYISEHTKNKILKAMKDIHYYPNEVARSLYTNQTNLIGLIFPTTNNPFFSELIYYLEKALYKNGKRILLSNSMNEIEVEKDYLNMLRSNKVDGIIVGSHNERLVDYQIPNLPIVAIDKDPGPDIPNIRSDNYAGGKIAVDELINKGCKKILYLSGAEKGKPEMDLRKEAYINQMKKINKQPIIVNTSFSDSTDKKIQTIESIFKWYNDIDGIIAGDDMLAALVINTTEKLNKKIPEELKVIGFDGSRMTLSFLPHLTTIQQPIKKIANKAVEVLLREIESGQRIPNEIIYPVKLISGETT